MFGEGWLKTQDYRLEFTDRFSDVTRHLPDGQVLELKLELSSRLTVYSIFTIFLPRPCLLSLPPSPVWARLLYSSIYAYIVPDTRL